MEDPASSPQTLNVEGKEESAAKKQNIEDIPQEKWKSLLINWIGSSETLDLEFISHMTDDYWICEKCGEQLKSEKNTILHMEEEHTEDLSQKQLESLQNLTGSSGNEEEKNFGYQIKIIHSVKNYVCETCGKRNIQEENMRSHVKIEHLEDLPQEQMEDLPDISKIHEKRHGK